MLTKQSLGRVTLAYKGEYSSSKNYEYLDVVSYNGGSYAAKKATHNIAPTLNSNSENWQLLVAAAAGAPQIDENNNLYWNSDNSSIIVNSTNSVYAATSNAACPSDGSALWSSAPPILATAGYIWTKSTVHFNIGDANLYSVSYQAPQNEATYVAGSSYEITDIVPAFGFISSPPTYARVSICLPNNFAEGTAVQIDKETAEFLPEIRTVNGVFLGGFEAAPSQEDFDIISYQIMTPVITKNILSFILKRADGTDWYGDFQGQSNTPIAGLVKHIKFTVT